MFYSFQIQRHSYGAATTASDETPWCPKWVVISSCIASKEIRSQEADIMDEWTLDMEVDDSQDAYNIDEDIEGKASELDGERAQTKNSQLKGLIPARRYTI